jgi:hypothetical protein
MEGYCASIRGNAAQSRRIGRMMDETALGKKRKKGRAISDPASKRNRILLKSTYYSSDHEEQ